MYSSRSAAGAHIVRVYTPTTAKHRAGASPSKTVTVYKWHYLSDFAYTDRQVDSSNWSNAGDVANINGHSYVHSLYNTGGYKGDSGYIEYNLSRACLTFRTTGGLTDESVSGGSAQLEVQDDGVPIWTKSMTLGQSQPVSVSVRGGLRLRLDTTTLKDMTNWSDETTAAFGDARVLCRF